MKMTKLFPLNVHPFTDLTLLHSERSKLDRVLTVLSAIGLNNNYSIAQIKIFLMLLTVFRNCPVILAAALAHETYLHVSSCDLDDMLNEFPNGMEGSNHDSLGDNKDDEKEEETEDKVQGIPYLFSYRMMALSVFKMTPYM